MSLEPPIGFRHHAQLSSFFVDEVAYALLDLTCLLTTGRSSEALLDYLGSGEHMSERVRLFPYGDILPTALPEISEYAEMGNHYDGCTGPDKGSRGETSCSCMPTLAPTVAGSSRLGRIVSCQGFSRMLHRIVDTASDHNMRCATSDHLTYRVASISSPPPYSIPAPSLPPHVKSFSGSRSS